MENLETTKTILDQKIPGDLNVEVKKTSVFKALLYFGSFVLVILVGIYAAKPDLFKGAILVPSKTDVAPVEVSSIQVNPVFTKNLINNTNRTLVLAIAGSFEEPAGNDLSGSNGLSISGGNSLQRTVYTSEYSVLFSKKDTGEGTIEVPIENLRLNNVGLNYLVLDVSDEFSNLNPGTWIMKLKQVNSDNTAFVTKSNIIRIVENDTDVASVANLKAGFDQTAGLQYRAVINSVLTNNSHIAYLESKINSAKLTLSQNGTDEEFAISDLALATADTDFPNSQDSVVSASDIAAKNLSGDFDAVLSFNMVFEKNSTNSLPYVIKVTSNNQALTIPAANPDPGPDEPEPDPDPSPLTCSDRLAPSSISVSPTSYDFGNVIRRETANSEIVVSKSLGQTFTNLRFMIDDDNNEITARIGDRAIPESRTSENGLFDIENSLTMTLSFTPGRTTSYNNRILVFDTQVPDNCDPIATIAITGQGVNAPQETSDDPDEGIAYINDQRPFEDRGYNVGSRNRDYYASSYSYMPETLPPIAEPTHTSEVATRSTTSGTSNASSMPIANTGPGLILYPALLGLSAVIAKRRTKI